MNHSTKFATSPTRTRVIESSFVRGSTIHVLLVSHCLVLMIIATYHTREGSKIVFIVFRHQYTTVQGVLTEEPDRVSQVMVRWAEGISRESIVLVDGIVQRPPPDQEEVHSTTIQEFEIKICKVCAYLCGWNIHPNGRLIRHA